MYGMFTYIYHNFKPNMGKYSIHGANGLGTEGEYFLGSTLLGPMQIPWQTEISYL